MHIGDAIIALMLGVGLTGYAYRDHLYRLDLWIIAKFKELSALDRYQYPGRHRFNPTEEFSAFRQDGTQFIATPMSAA